MCTIKHDPIIELPKGKTFTAYKVFGRGKIENIPRSFDVIDIFNIGTNKWYKKGYKTEQEGFQVFAEKKDADQFMWPVDVILPLTINTKDIVKAGLWGYGEGSLVYEVKKFKLSKKQWEKRNKEN